MTDSGCDIHALHGDIVAAGHGTVTLIHVPMHETTGIASHGQRGIDQGAARVNGAYQRLVGFHDQCHWLDPVGIGVIGEHEQLVG